MAEINKEDWLKWVALSTTVLAVAAAISSLRSSTYSTRTQLQTTIENNQWSYFQSKSIKQHTLECQLDIFRLDRLRASSEQVNKYLDEKIKLYESDIARYNKEKEYIKAQAEASSAKEDQYKEKGGKFSIAAVFLQIAIMLSSMSALLKRKMSWLVGLAIGCVGLLLMLNGLLL
jgi:hypothetical protein